MKTIAICNQKGGVGKTTTAFCLQAGLVERGFNCLLIDFEAQRNLTATLGLADDQPTIFDVLTGDADIHEAIIEKPTGAFISGDVRLSLIDDYLSGNRKYEALRDAIKPLKYDFCIIDTPPALGTLTLNALTASNYVLMTARADLYSCYGITDLEDTIKAIRSTTNKKLKTIGILLTQFDNRTKLSKGMKETLDTVADAFKTSLFDTKIRHSVKASEIQLRPEGLFKYAPKAPVTEDYRQLIEELLNRMNQS